MNFSQSGKGFFSFGAIGGGGARGSIRDMGPTIRVRWPNGRHSAKAQNEGNEILGDREKELFHFQNPRRMTERKPSMVFGGAASEIAIVQSRADLTVASEWLVPKPTAASW